jgi:hypothetical protein
VPHPHGIPIDAERSPFQVWSHNIAGTDRLIGSAAVWHLPERFGLVDGEPVTKANAKFLWPLDAPDAGCKIRAEKSGISGLIRKPTYGREPAINCARSELT